MQCNEPLIHIFYDELCALIQSLMSRIVSQRSWEKFIELHLEVLTSATLKKIYSHQKKLILAERKLFFNEVEKFIISIIEYLLDKVPIENKLLRNFQCLHPLRLQNLPMVIKSCDIDKLCDEWKLYVAENIDETTVSAEVPSGSITRIDAYWSAIQKITNSLGELKYPLLSCLVRAVLTLSH
ncbi:hypothetical protein PR048_013550 [Dryococelus australis]|uniref:Uncharacterized protein n=1 Tax=Dryococelus australis TaxID=614101 RepID=A0ABQ9HTA8_9NEOP|nr:hypothetical protein PR048_013550 [Dryococelus australis]